MRRLGPLGLAPVLGVAPHRVVAAVEPKIAQRLEYPHHRQPLPPRLGLVFRQQLIEPLPPSPKLLHRLYAALVAELRRFRTDRLTHRFPGALQLPLIVLIGFFSTNYALRIFAISSTSSIPNAAPSLHWRLCGPKRQWGPVCTPIDAGCIGVIGKSMGWT